MITITVANNKLNERIFKQIGELVRVKLEMPVSVRLAMARFDR